MKSLTTSQIQAMDDFRLLRFFNYFSNQLFNKVDIDVDSIKQKVPPEVQALTEMQTVEKNEDQYHQPLEQKEAVAFARTSLLQLAADENVEPALATAIDNYRDDEQPAGVILALGAAVSLILLLATSKIKYETGKGWEINIGGNRNPEELKSVTGLIKELFHAIPDSILKLTKK